jgi:Rrf2 family protein
VVSLREAGLVVSTRGAHGGYQLARDPGAIRMSDIVTALEGPIAPMVCASPVGHASEMCERSDFCTVERLWLRVRDAVVEALDSMSLAELAMPRLGHPAHPGPGSGPDAVLIALRPLPTRDPKESIAQP